MRGVVFLGVGLLALGLAREVASAPAIGIAAADVNLPVTQLMGTGLFGSVTALGNAADATPTLAQLQAFDAVLAYTNYFAFDPTGFGDVLRQYVDGGGKVVLAAYGLTPGFGLAGGIMSPGYSPLTTGAGGAVAATLNALVASPIFDGVNLGTLSFYTSANDGHPGLDSGATLLADNGDGVRVIAINADRTVIANNLYPGAQVQSDPQFYRLLANELAFLTQGTETPEPASSSLLAMGLLGLAGWRRRGGVR